MPILPIRTMNFPLTCLLATFASLALAAESPPEMTFDQALEQLKTYDYGQNDKPLRVIELQAVRHATDAAGRADVAQRLAAVLAAPDTPLAARVFLCQQLLVVGTEAQVPLLAKMLDDPQTAEIARYTLDAIPGEASLAALRRALGRLQGLTANRGHQLAGPAPRRCVGQLAGPVAVARRSSGRRRSSRSFGQDRHARSRGDPAESGRRPASRNPAAQCPAAVRRAAGGGRRHGDRHRDLRADLGSRPASRTARGRTGRPGESRPGQGRADSS